MKRRALAACLAAAAAFSGPPSAAAGAGAPPAPTDEARFEALLREIGTLRDDLDRLARRERSLLNDIERLEVERALSSKELSRLALQRESTRRERDESRAKLAAARARIAEGEALLARQLREAYETGRLREVRMLLALTEPVDVMRAVAYLDVMARRQAAAVEDLRRRRAEAESLEEALVEQARSLEALESQTRARAAELEAVRSRSSDLLAAIRSEGATGRRAVAELTRAAEELERAIVAGHAAPGSGAAPLPRPVAIDKLQGALEWPVPGKVAVPFGDVRHPRFGTTTPHPGIDIQTAPGTPIRAVLGGRVVFSRRFSGYGNTVLVDHGDGCLTVYARAALLDVLEGQEVLPGQILGVSADRAFDDGPPTVYFEFRQDGRAVDPARWLKRRPGGAGEEVR